MVRKNRQGNPRLKKKQRARIKPRREASPIQLPSWPRKSKKNR
jgi:hypothetical protein